jgi:hypothetical protein
VIKAIFMTDVMFNAVSRKGGERIFIRLKDESNKGDRPIRIQCRCLATPSFRAHFQEALKAAGFETPPKQELLTLVGWSNKIID